MFKYDVFVYGPIAIDNIIMLPYLPTPEVDVIPLEDRYELGAAGANSAVWLASWGLKVCLAGNGIGTDRYGDLVWEHLQKYPALDVRHLRRYNEFPTPLVRCLVTPDGERSFIVYRQLHAMPDTPLTSQMIAGSRSLTLSLHAVQEHYPAIESARSMGILTVVGDIVHPDHPSLPYTDVAVNSKAYSRQYFPDIDPIQHAHMLHNINKGVVITTDGPYPIHAIDKDGSELLAYPPEVEVVDATGAGDTFKAGLIYGLVSHWSLKESLAWATAAGALNVQRVGGASNPAAVAEISNLVGRIRIREM